MADETTPNAPASDLRPGEREASDQPPPLRAPLTRAQIISLVVPALSLGLLCILLLWGTLSTVRRPPDGPAPPSRPTGTAPAAGGLPVAALPAVTEPPPVTEPRPALPTATEPPPAPSTATAVLPDSPMTPPTATLEPPTVTAEPPTSLPAPPAPPTVTPIPPPPVPRPLQHSLVGRRIGLDPGHGPRGDLGAVLVQKNKLILAEDELNLDVALRCRDLLVARGAQVVLTRETQDTFTAPWPTDANGDGIKGGAADDLQTRIDILDAFHAEAFLSIHANSHANPAKRQGTQALYCASDDCLFPAANHRLGTLVLDALDQQLAAVGIPVKQRELRTDLWSDGPGEPIQHLYMLGPAAPPHHPRATLMPGVVVESLYVTSPDEAAALKQGPVRQAIAEAYADALEAFLLNEP